MDALNGLRSLTVPHNHQTRIKNPNQRFSLLVELAVLVEVDLFFICGSVLASEISK